MENPSKQYCFKLGLKFVFLSGAKNLGLFVASSSSENVTDLGEFNFQSFSL